MKKFFFCVSLVLTGLMSGCIDKNEPVDADSKPDWLGGSIYQELRNPDQSRLTGTFNTYLRLVDDLKLSETLDRTGSKTVFPANDAAFERFFQSNDWGVRSYDDLTDAQKKLLLYNSMLDNALLLNMLSNRSNTTDASNPTTEKGMAMKHQTNANVIDSVEYLVKGSDMPQNNKYWDKYRDKGIHLVSDDSRSMMVHFTREHMLTNGITTSGENSDFAILTGTPYTEGVAYIFGDRIIRGDITCMNGYVHQMEDVIVPPGNIGQVLRNAKDTKYFSRILDYFAVPYYTAAVTNDYNAWVRQQTDSKYTQIDSIFQIRYLSNQTGHNITNDPDGNLVSGSSVLAFDPGWNQYSPLQSTAQVDYALNDVAAMFVPVDEAIEQFFVEGNGAYLIDIYGDRPNTKENLAENLDSLQSRRPDILTNFIKNLMKPSFINTVPSRFEGIQNDAQMNMGMNTSLLQKKENGKYDIVMANNGVIYKLNQMIAPDRYQSVMGPSSTYLDMQVMNWAVTDPEAQSSSNKLNVGFSYYLLAMTANFGFFIPDDEAFDNFYIDPTSLGHQQPEALKFYYDATTRTTLHCDRYAYDPATGTVGDRLGEVSISRVKSLLIDILNYHTVVLDEGEVIGEGGKHYYKTKHGGEIYVEAGTQGTKVYGGQQIDNNFTPATIEEVYNQKNGRAYRIDRALQPPVNSVSKTLKSDSRFSEFYNVCAGFSAKDLLAWAGISDSVNSFGITAQDAYIIFSSDRGSGKNVVANSCLDENVKMFNTYNYTLYAPNNQAMEIAYGAGLPSWDDIEAIYTRYTDPDGEYSADQIEAAKAEAYAKIRALRDFARYHFQSLSMYADKGSFDTQICQSLSRDNLGIAIDLKVTGSDDRITVQDVAGVTHVIDATDGSKLVNKMARDYWFNSSRTSATEIYTSSFCAVHEISEPFYVYASKKFNDAWSSREAMARSLNEYKELKKQNKL